VQDLVVPHAFGEHEMCDEKWCRGKKDPKYKHTDLPYGKDLYGEDLSATDQSGLHCFNCFMLPSRDVDIHATRVNGLSVKSIHGQRTLLKENQPVVIAVPLENALADFLYFIEQTVSNKRHPGQNENNIYTVLIGHNSQVFDAPTLLRRGSNQFSAKLSSLNVYFADTLPLIKKLVQAKHPSLQLTDGTMSKTNQSAIYKQLFDESFDAHDALEDVKALRKIIFHSSLELTPEMLTD
jgi:hypothetical protein